MQNSNEFFMRLALEEAYKAYKLGEVPIGCVIVYEDRVISTGFNQRNTGKSAIYHAETIAIDKACKLFGDWRLEGCRIFVTVEPCAMCSGAILQARMDTLIFGAKNEKSGCCGSIINLLQNEKFNHKVNIISGVMERECSLLMKDFFKILRKN